MKKCFLRKLKRSSSESFIPRLDTLTDDIYDRNVKKILNLINYTKSNKTGYHAESFESGYYSFSDEKHNIKGQRDPRERLENVPFSFKDKVVLDIGCNQGGMLDFISKDIKFGVGIDFNYKMINIASKIRSHKNSKNLSYFVFNLETENLNYIKDFLPSDKVDIVFLLSVCMWIKNWKEVIKFTSEISDTILFETNGSEEQQNEQVDYLKSIFSNITVVNETSEDDETQKNRKLFLCNKY